MTLKRLWTSSEKYQLWLKAANRLYGSQPGKIAALKLDPKSGEPSVDWEISLSGTVNSMIAADGQLIVSTVAGGIYCFSAASDAKPVVRKNAEIKPQSDKGPHSDSVAKFIKQFGIDDGYCLALGLKDGLWLAELAKQSGLQIIGVESNSATVAAVRNRLDNARLYGSRISVHESHPSQFEVSPYLANMIVSENVPTSGIDHGAGFVRKVFHALRPYGGVAVFQLTDQQHTAFQQAVQEANLQQAEVSKTRIDYSSQTQRCPARLWRLDSPKRRCLKHNRIKRPSGQGPVRGFMVRWINE